MQTKNMVSDTIPLLVLFGAFGAACFPGTQVLDAPAPAPCSGTRLSAGTPQPHAPYVSTLAWLDASTLVIAVGATTFDVPDGNGGAAIGRDSADAAGIVVLDANAGSVIRAWHGVDPYLLEPRRGASGEMLFAELARGSGGRAGRVDVMTGCMTATPWESDTSFVLDPDDDELVAEHDVDRSHTVTVIDAATLSTRASAQLPPHTFTSYDAASRSLVSIEWDRGTIESRDARTLALGAHRTLGVELVPWTFRPGRRELVASYVSRCKLEPHHGRAVMAAACARGSVTRWGLLRLSLDTLADASRTIESTDHDFVALRRISWQPSGAHAIVQCRPIGEELCVWDPDAGTTTRLPPMPLAYTISQIAWRDDDVFAAPSNDQKVILRSLSRGAQLASFALPHL